MKLRSSICLLLMLISFSCFAAKKNPVSDSLRTALLKNISKKTPTDTAGINKVNQLAAEYISVDPDSSMYYAQIAIKNSKQINYQKGIADGLVSIATSFEYKSQFEIAIKNLDSALLIYSLCNDKLGTSKCYETYGYLYQKTGDYKKAFFYLNKSLLIKQRIKDQAGEAGIYTEFGNLYDNLGNPSTALDYYFKSLNITTKLHNPEATCFNYYNIGIMLESMKIYPEALVYYNKALKLSVQQQNFLGICISTQNIGEIMLAEGKYDEAIKYINKSLVIAIKAGNQDVIGYGYNDLGLCYMYKNENEKSKTYLEKSLKIATDSKIDFNKATALINLALYYNRRSDYNKADVYAVRAKSMADRLGSIHLRTDAFVQLIDALGGLGKYKEAFLARKDFDKMTANFKMDESIRRFTSYNLTFDFAAKQQLQIQQQKASALLYQQKIHDQRLLNFIFFIITAAMVIIVAVYYLQKRKQIKVNAKLVESNQQVLEQKIDLDDQAEKLNDLNKLKDRLIAILAHDLRSPLSTLRGLFQLLADETLTQEELLDMIPEVVKKLDYTSDFLDTLLFWVNSQMDNFDASIKQFSIGEIINNETTNYKEQAAAKGINLICNISTELIALADPNSTRIVARNLVTNAIKFSRNNDTIEVSAVIKDNDILISIRDTGIGMTEDQANKLFRNKVESKQGTRSESGTGMGLLFCKDLVEKFHGTIWVESEIGKGTTFYFTMPLQRVNEEQLKLEALS